MAKWTHGSQEQLWWDGKWRTHMFNVGIKKGGPQSSVESLNSQVLP